MWSSGDNGEPRLLPPSTLYRPGTRPQPGPALGPSTGTFTAEASSIQPAAARTQAAGARPCPSPAR